MYLFTLLIKDSINPVGSKHIRQVLGWVTHSFSSFIQCLNC